MMYEALRKGATVEEIHAITKVKHWFIEQMQELVQEEETLLTAKGNLPSDAALLSAKKNGFSDKYLSKILEIPEDAVRHRRMELGIEENWEPVHVSGTEDKAYYYSTYNGTDKNPIAGEKPKVMILGGGPNRIGQGIEFDYCCVHASLALKKLGFDTIIVNCNPETVSTDYDTSDKLYFEPLTLEDVLSIYHKEKPVGVIAQFGGQTPLNLAADLEKNGVKRLVFFSSVAVYGLNKENPDENHPADPFNHYGKSKWQAEEVLQEWFRSHKDWNIDIIRPTVIFGERNRGNVYNLLKQISGGKFLRVGKGDNKKSMAYVGNIVAFVKCMVENVTTGYNVFNYIDKPDFTMNELVDLIERVLHKRIPATHFPYWMGMLGGYCFDLLAKLTGKKLAISSVRVKKFCATTQFDASKVGASGFVPPFTLEEGLSRTLEFEFVNPRIDEIVFKSE